MAALGVSSAGKLSVPPSWLLLSLVALALPATTRGKFLLDKRVFGGGLYSCHSYVLHEQSQNEKVSKVCLSCLHLYLRDGGLCEDAEAIRAHEQSDHQGHDGGRRGKEANDGDGRGGL